MRLHQLKVGFISLSHLNGISGQSSQLGSLTVSKEATPEADLPNQIEFPILNHLPSGSTSLFLLIRKASQAARLALPIQLRNVGTWPNFSNITCRRSAVGSVTSQVDHAVWQLCKALITCSFSKVKARGTFWLRSLHWSVTDSSHQKPDAFTGI